MITNTSELLLQLQQFESEIFPRSIAVGEVPWFCCIEGSVPVLVSAPHACRHMRDGVEKMSEEFTAALAKQVAGLTGCHAIYTRYKSDEDPNWVTLGAYKSRVAELVLQHGIRFVIDLHGMTNRHHMGVALGTMHGRACRHFDVIAPFTRHGFEVVSADAVPPPLELIDGVPLPPGGGAEQHRQSVVTDHPRFTGGLRNHTVTRFAVEQLGISAVQVEIASVNRIVFRAAVSDWPYEYCGSAEGITATVNALIALVNR